MFDQIASALSVCEACSFHQVLSDSLIVHALPWFFAASFAC